MVDRITFFISLVNLSSVNRTAKYVKNDSAKSSRDGLSFAYVDINVGSLF
jgi:hypothetical protein